MKRAAFILHWLPSASKTSTKGYTTVHGLPANPSFVSAIATVDALSLDENGQPWAGTIDGVRFLAYAERRRAGYR